MTKRIGALANAYRDSLILFTAVEADVFSLLGEGSNAQDIAQKTGWDTRGTRMLLDALVALDLLEKCGAEYRNTAVATACLARGGETYQGNIVKHNRACMEAWLHLGEALKRGRSLREPGETRSDEELRNFILGMSDIGKLSAQEILAKANLAEYRHVLDAGGGPASYSIAFLKAHPEMRATLFDRPEVIPIAREQVQEAGLEARFDFMAGDLTTDTIGEGYDLILVSNIIHSLGAEKNRLLVKKCADALEPGGLLIIKDFLVEDNRTGPAFGLMFALHMFVNTEEGDTYSASELNEWGREAGLTAGEIVEVAANSRLWLARKREA